MHPLGEREVALEPDPVAQRLEVRAVAERRSGARSERNFPVIPEPIGNESRETRLLRRVLRPRGRGKGRDQKVGKFFS